MQITDILAQMGGLQSMALGFAVSCRPENRTVMRIEEKL